MVSLSPHTAREPTDRGHKALMPYVNVRVIATVRACVFLQFYSLCSTCVCAGFCTNFFFASGACHNSTAHTFPASRA
eukprot:COSAG02_NODE_4125_length_5743_cov_5.905741_6_plen_77_part_00